MERLPYVRLGQPRSKTQRVLKLEMAMVQPNEEQAEILKYLPLTESTYYILLALVEPLHGYGVMQKVEALSHGTVKIGPGTLYGAFQALEKEALIVKVSEEERRKSYALTTKGRQVLKVQIEHLEIMTQNGLAILESL